MNGILLKQAREGIKRIINENKTTIVIFRKQLIDDGFGGTVEDPYGEPDPDTVKCRISHEKKGPDTLKSVPPGLSTNLVRYILVDYKTIIYENDPFEDEMIGKSFRIGPVDPLIKFGGIIGSQAPLKEAIRAEGET